MPPKRKAITVKEEKPDPAVLDKVDKYSPSASDEQDHNTNLYTHTPSDKDDEFDAARTPKKVKSKASSTTAPPKTPKSAKSSSSSTPKSSPSKANFDDLSAKGKYATMVWEAGMATINKAHVTEVVSHPLALIASNCGRLMHARPGSALRSRKT